MKYGNVALRGINIRLGQSAKMVLSCQGVTTTFIVSYLPDMVVYRSGLCNLLTRNNTLLVGMKHGIRNVIGKSPILERSETKNKSDIPRKSVSKPTGSKRRTVNDSLSHHVSEQKLRWEIYSVIFRKPSNSKETVTHSGT